MSYERNRDTSGRANITRQSEMAIPRPDIFRDVISLLAQVFILLIDTATQEVPMKNI